jgi:serine/threonine protein kinase/tetratricopeptide (TPR) repeat protein
MAIGAFTIESRIAEGGMGVVFLAHRSDGKFEQSVAIKLLTTTIASEEMRARFLAERRILASLSHPNIASLLDGGETDDGIPYLVMEYVDGLSIIEYCERNDLPLPARLRLFRQVCGAVQYAHRNLVIHRDIKPANIFVTQDGTPKLLDFGIAKLLDADGSAADLTRVGSRIMTPRHASPEQVLGVAVTTATDIYSLGVLLYELACGQFPYDIDGETRPSTIEKCIVDEMPLSPGRYMGKSGARDLDAIVLKALRKKPENRYRSPGELADDLKRFLDREPVEARPLTVAYTLSSFWRRHKALSVATSLAVVAIIAGAGTATVGLMQARESERIALQEAATSKAVSDFLVGVFREADPHTSSGDEPTVSEVLDAGAQQIDEDLAGSPAVKARLLETLSSVYKARGDHVEAIRMLEEALTISASETPGDLATRARISNDLGDLYRMRDDPDKARHYLESASSLHREIGTPATKDRADNANNLGLLYRVTGEPELALASFEEALAMRETLYEPPHPDIANSLHNLAWYYGQLDNFELAEHYGVQAVAMREALFGEAHGRVASSLHNLVRVYLMQNKLDQALATAARSVEIHSRVYGADHDWTLGAMHWQAVVLREAGKLDDALAIWQSVHDRSAADKDTLPFDLASAKRFLGSIWLDLGEVEKAERLLRDAQAEFDKPDIPVLASRELNRTRYAEALLANGKIAEAGAQLLPGGDFRLEDLAGDTYDFERQIVIAEYLRQAGRLDEALAFSRRAIAGFDADNDLAMLTLADARAQQGRTLADAGRSDEATTAIQEALQIYESLRGVDYWKAGRVRAELQMADVDRRNAE